MTNENSEKQPVFLLCPHSKGYSALSLFVEVDPADKSKVLAIGLEALKDKNSKESSYDAVLQAQNDPKTEREPVGRLNVTEFASGMIHIKQHDALKVSVAPAGEDLRLTISMRVGLDQRFLIGGKDQSKRDVILHYRPDTQTWEARATRLQDYTGRSVVDGQPLRISGLCFPITATGVYRIVAATESDDPIILMDR
jgi:hypothetical protein